MHYVYGSVVVLAMIPIGFLLNWFDDLLIEHINNRDVSFTITGILTFVAFCADLYILGKVMQ